MTDLLRIPNWSSGPKPGGATMAASRATVGGPISMVASFVAVVSHRSAMSIPHKSARSHPFCGWYWIRSSKEVNRCLEEQSFTERWTAHVKS